MFWKISRILTEHRADRRGLALALAKKARRSTAARREEMPGTCRKSSCRGKLAFSVCVVNADAVQDAADALRNNSASDILIANAGIGGNNKETQTLKPSRKKVIDIIVSARAIRFRMFAGDVKRGSGQLVAISSLAGFRGLPKSAAYCASKAGMTAFFESVRLDVQNKGVAVTIIQPGFIKTPLTSGRENKMPFLMELEDSIPHFLRAIEKKKKFAAFPWQLATIVRAGKFFPAWLYDKIAGGAKYRE